MRHESKPVEPADTEAARKEASGSVDTMQVDQASRGEDSNSVRQTTEAASRTAENDAPHIASAGHRSASTHQRRPIGQGLGSETIGSSVSAPELRVQDFAQSKSMPPPPEQNRAQERHNNHQLQIITSDNDVTKGMSDGMDAAGSPDMRTSSPNTTRPGTRNASLDSRGSGDRSRSERGGDADMEDRRSSRGNLGRTERERNGHREIGGRTRSERGLRSERAHGEDGDREKEDRDRDRRRDREKDRHSDKDRERERDRKERERDRDRDRDRERHRRDERDRDRDSSSRKDRDQASSRGTTSGTGRENVQEDHGLPTRPDLSRHRGSMTDDAGKRRRQTEEDVSTKLRTHV